MQVLPRQLTSRIIDDLLYFPVVGIVGPRQVGKTTLARKIAEGQSTRLLDLQRPADYAQLEQSEFLLPDLAEKLIVIDEMQLMPELFGRLRPIVDEDRRPGRFLLLGSASPDLMRGASESLAGRVTYTELTPLSLTELSAPAAEWQKHLLLGGFPEPYLQLPAERVTPWYRAFIMTYLTRDLSELGRSVNQGEFNRLLRMLAHDHGGLFNASALSRSLTVTNDTIRRYIDILERSMLLRRLPPYLPNLRKRLIKSPRLYLRDSGMRHYLLGIQDFSTLLGHPGIGASWEGYVIEEIARNAGPDTQFSFFRTADGTEIDLVIESGSRLLAVECKFSDAPKLSKGFYTAQQLIQPHHSYIITPSSNRYAVNQHTTVINLPDFLYEIAALGI
ncbi:ATP-binding protein [Neolewinella sp.]|uniref:ATP-binding protein n=1 Tax=Neolewinella sp. TaxID=2993543 RepID=UPI003B528E6C